MQIGIVGLGRMGANIARRIRRTGGEPHVYDSDDTAVARLVGEGMTGRGSLTELVQRLDAPRTVWLMLPAGEVTDTAVATMADLLSPGDTLIDGGNTWWRDDLVRAERLAARGIAYLDVGTSGGVWGLERGYCLMVGGEAAAFERLIPVWQALAQGAGRLPRTPGREGSPSAAEQGFIHAGGSGAGHFVKMVHNGIEYGVMQAFAEGFELISRANSETVPEDLRLDLDGAAIAEVWRRGSVLSSWLLDLIAAALVEDAELGGYSGHVQDSGEARWFLDAATAEEVPAHVISAALYARFRSRQDGSFAEKILSAMRRQFGGHVEVKRN